MTHSAELRAIERNQELMMCPRGMHFTDHLKRGDYVVVDTDNWRYEHVQHDSDL